MSFALEPPRAFTRGRAAERDAPAPHDRRAQSPDPKTRQYTPRQVELAAAAVHAGRMAYREAAAVYAVPKSTIVDWTSRGAGVGRRAARSPGAQPVITDAEEEFLVECLVHFSDQYTPMTFHTFGELIAGLYPGRCAHNGRRFAASSWWIRGFLRRHSSDLECSAAVPVDHLHRITERDIAQLRTVFEEFNALVEKLALTDAQVHAFDETKVSATAEDACHARVIHRRGAKPYRRVGVKTQKASLVAFISANGQTLPPAMLHPQDKRVPREHAQAWDTTSHQPDTRPVPRRP